MKPSTNPMSSFYLTVMQDMELKAGEIVEVYIDHRDGTLRLEKDNG